MLSRFEQPWGPVVIVSSLIFFFFSYRERRFSFCGHDSKHSTVHNYKEDVGNKAYVGSYFVDLIVCGQCFLKLLIFSLL